MTNLEQLTALVRDTKKLCPYRPDGDVVPYHEQVTVGANCPVCGGTGQVLAYPELHEVLLEPCLGPQFYGGQVNNPGCLGPRCPVCAGTGYVPRDLSSLPAAYREAALCGMLWEAMPKFRWPSYDTGDTPDSESMCAALIAAIGAKE